MSNPPKTPMRPRITQAEIHLSHACNLSCDSCSHFSQDGHSGRLTVSSFLQEVGPWGRRIQPRFVLLLGGEPLLNPDVCELLVATRQVWPEDAVRVLLVTNGFLLYKYPRLAEALKTHRVRLDISRHHNSSMYQERFETAVALARSWGIEPVIRESFRDWTYIYRGNGKDTLPYTDGNPQASWRACVSKDCTQIHEGKLWKCPPVAYLPMQHRKYGLDEKAWAPFLSYHPLSPDCTDAELQEFIGRRCENICGQCPARPEAFVKPLPIRPGQMSLPVVSG